MLPHFFALGFYQYFQATANPPPLPPLSRATDKELLTKEAFTYLDNTVRHDEGTNKVGKNCLFPFLWIDSERPLPHW